MEQLNQIHLFLASIEDNTPNIHCYISKELVAEKALNGGTVIRELGKLIDGNGGRTTVFVSGKEKCSGIQQALDTAITFLG
jgi:alanyl-tRNA synthetase